MSKNPNIVERGVKAKPHTSQSLLTKRVFTIMEYVKKKKKRHIVLLNCTFLSQLR